MLYKENLEYYSAMRNEATLPFATTWMEYMEYIEYIVSEIRETEKDKCHMISLKLSGILKKPDS